MDRVMVSGKGKGAHVRWRWCTGCSVNKDLFCLGCVSVGSYLVITCCHIEILGYPETGSTCLVLCLSVWCMQTESVSSTCMCRHRGVVRMLVELHCSMCHMAYANGSNSQHVSAQADMQCIVLLQLQQAPGILPPPVPAGRPPPGSLQAPHRSAMQTWSPQSHVAHCNCKSSWARKRRKVLLLLLIWWLSFINHDNQQLGAGRCINGCNAML